MIQHQKKNIAGFIASENGKQNLQSRRKETEAEGHRNYILKNLTLTTSYGLVFPFL